MFDQVTLHTERFPAFVTVVCLVSVVSLHVGPQVGSVSKLLTTVSTAVGFLSSVGPHVSL